MTYFPVAFMTGLFFAGYMTGVMVAMLLHRREHQAWCKLFDRQQAVLEQLADTKKGNA